MPRRLTIAEVRQVMEPYGFFLIDDGRHPYKNQDSYLKVYDSQLNKTKVITLRQIRSNYIYRDKRAKFDYNDILPVSLNPETPQRERFNFMNILPVSQNPAPAPPKTKLQRFIQNINEPLLSNLPEAEQQKYFDIYQKIMKGFGKQKKFNLNLSKDGQSKQIVLLLLLKAFKQIKMKLNKIIRVGVKTSDNEAFFSLTADTIQYFQDLLNEEAPQEMSDSQSDVFDKYTDWESIEFSFDINPKAQGGFFPFLNKTSLDLSKYGIFKEIIDSNYSTNCFIQAIKNSDIFTPSEIDLIQSTIKTRVIKVEDLQTLADLLNCQITIRIGKDNSNDTSFKKFDSKYGNKKKLTLILYMDHFMPCISLNVSEYYVAHYEELDKLYPDNSQRFIMIDDQGTTKKSPITIIRLIKLLLKYNALQVIPKREQERIAKLYNNLRIINTNDALDCSFKPIEVKDKNDNQMKVIRKLKGDKFDGYSMFGEHLEQKRLEQYYDKLQKVINSLGVRVNVRNYFRCSQLMEKVMFEYGCFDNVYKIAGPIAEKIRNGLTFPAPHTADNNPFYSNQKLYYIDINGAYLSCVNSIPAGKCGEDLKFNERNTTIGELIEKLYTIRTGLKQTDPILANTLKLMMNSSWGLSIRRSNNFEKTSPKDKDTFLKENVGYIVEYSNDFIKYIKSISVNYTYPQFAREVLTNFEAKINEVVKLCKHVFYYNIDALLIDEEDFHKLEQLGYIGNKLGQFKIEHIFTEIAIKSSRVYMATLDNGEIFNHSFGKKDYKTFVQDVKAMIN